MHRNVLEKGSWVMDWIKSVYQRYCMKEILISNLKVRGEERINMASI